MAHDEPQPTGEEQTPQASEANERTPAPPKFGPINLALAELQGEMEMPDSVETPVHEPPTSAGFPGTHESDRPGDRFGEQSPPHSAAFGDPDTSTLPEPLSDAAQALNSPPGDNDMPENYSSHAQGTAHASHALSPAATIATMMILSFVSGIIGAVLGLSSANKANSAAAKEGSEPEAPAISAADIDGMKNQLDELKKQRNEEMDGLQKQFEGIKKGASSSPELAAIQQKVNELAKNTAQVVPVAETVKSLESRLAGLEKTVKTMSSEVTAAHSERVAAASGTSGNPTPSSSDTEKGDTAKPVIEDVAASDAAMTQGTDLFKQGKFQEAYDVFKKLETSNPNDARVWYFAALSLGCAKNDWVGETRTLVEKGMEVEKSGKLKTADIDAAFQMLTQQTGKDWLAFYRKKIKTPS